MTELTDKDLTPPKQAQKAAQRALDYRDRYGDEVKGMTETGWSRAEQIASGKPLDIETIKKISQFARHEDNADIDDEHEGEPWKDNGYIAWIGWGSDAAIKEWAPKVVEKYEQKQNDAGFSPSAHPRDDEGRFITKDGGGSSGDDDDETDGQDQSVNATNLPKDAAEKLLDKSRKSLESSSKCFAKKVDEEYKSVEDAIGSEVFSVQASALETILDNYKIKYKRTSKECEYVDFNIGGGTLTVRFAMTKSDSAKDYTVVPGEEGDSFKDIIKALNDNIDDIQKVKNAKQFPEVYYCCHMVPGLAGYSSGNLLMPLQTMQEMCASFEGKPVFVMHENDALGNLEYRDGTVTECWYEPMDGWLWAKMIIDSDEARDCIRKGWGVSNAYTALEYGGSGEYNNIPYESQVNRAAFDHMAIVPNPRYESSKVYTKDEYKNYKKLLEEKRNSLHNSKEIVNAEPKEHYKNAEGRKIMKNKDEEDKGRQTEEEGDTEEEYKNNEDDYLPKEYMSMKVNTDDGEMTVKEMVNAYKKMKKNMGDYEKEEEEEEDNKKKSKEPERASTDKDNKKNSKSQEDDPIAVANAKFNQMSEESGQQFPAFETLQDRAERGRQRY